MDKKSKLKNIEKELESLHKILAFEGYEDFNDDDITVIQKKIKKLEKQASELKKPDPPPQKKEFIVRLEGIAPVTVEYRALAFTEEEAFQMADKRLAQPLGPPQPNMNKFVKRKASVKNRFTGMINWIMNF